MAKANKQTGTSLDRPTSASSSPSSAPSRLSTTSKIPKPAQLKLKDMSHMTRSEMIRNNPGVFVPKIKEKPHSLKPLAMILEINDQGEKDFSHPYEYELKMFTPDPKFLISKSGEPTFKKVEEVPLVVIENQKSLKLLVKDLSTKTVIGVDLEVHSPRSPKGIICVMQISTGETNYLVDTFKLRENLQLLQLLNNVFCNPMIVKVFHGARNDILWLQKDFGLYVVNMFDTYDAAKALNLPKLSLAFLLEHYCSVVVDKQFQRADWRIRPLPQEMLNYAREDAHYLVYVFERLKQDLKLNEDVNLLSTVWETSKLVCLTRYQFPRSTPKSKLKPQNQDKNTTE